jgi:excisionase family DNA binding protein
MAQPGDHAPDVLRDALAGSVDPVQVTLTISRKTAEKLLRVLDAENASGAVVVPVKELYTTTESAALLGISRSTLMKLIESGDIEAVKVGTHHRVPADELLAYQRARQVSRDRASELLTEFSSRAGDFQSNVTFRAEGQPSRRELGAGRESK